LENAGRRRKILDAAAKANPWAKMRALPPEAGGLAFVGRLQTGFKSPLLAVGLATPIGLGLGANVSFGVPDWVSRMSEPIGRLSNAMAKAGRELRLLDEAGWLPHYTMPFDLLEDLEDGHAVETTLHQHYEKQWPAVRQAFEDHLAVYVVDDQAKAAFRMALALHEAGFYRAVVLHVFPEIERLARCELHGGQLGGFASQPRLRELAGELYADQIDPGGFRGLALYQCLDDHLYTPVKTIEALDKAREDPVPNRHAAIHGLVAYDSRQSSVNALIMADYVLQVFAALRNGSDAPAAA
jgi:hypothetical protein